MRIIGTLTCIGVLFLGVVAHADSFRTGGPVTIDNDASCDISLLPAATLLLPYFEVDITSFAGTGETTIFTVTNTGQLPQIARVTLWTDLAYPVFTFNIFLTGYDVQSINLYDVITRGRIAPDEGTGADVSNLGEASRTNWDGPAWNNPVIDEQTCTNLPTTVSAALLTRIQNALTIGRAPSAETLPSCGTAGMVHANAVGYATIDVVGRCDATMPHDPSYFTNDIRFDNVLMGDYHQVNGDEDFAQGGTMVHIRAIPEGGTPRTREEDSDFEVNAPRTFYSAYQDPARPTFDARQPLPSVFAARWIEGGRSGFETFFKIWREVRQKAGSCSAYVKNAQEIREVVRFDDEENPEVISYDCTTLCTIPKTSMPSTSMVDVSDHYDLPRNTQDALSGWMYLNLDDRERDDVAKQAWVVISMRAEDRFSTDFDALALGNGCSAPVSTSQANQGDTRIGPAPNTRK